MGVRADDFVLHVHCGFHGAAAVYVACSGYRNSHLVRLETIVDVKKNYDSSDIYRDLIDHLAESFHSGSVCLLSDPGAASVNHWISSGLGALDEIMGGGFPAGRLVEVAGKPSCGKTTLVLAAARNAQEDGYIVVFVDTEQALLRSWVDMMGLDPHRVILADIDTVEGAFKLYRALCRGRPYDKKYFVIIDSVAGLDSEADLREQDRWDRMKLGDPFKEGQPGNLARAMSRGLRSVARMVARNDDVMVFVNQTRTKMGGFVKSDDTPGGRALKFHTSVRLFLSHKSRIVRTVKGRKHYVGVHVEATTVKNKLTAPFKTANMDIIFGVGLAPSGYGKKMKLSGVKK